MKKILTLLLVACMARAGAQTYNTLWIPDTLAGSTFNLTAKDTFKQMLPGNQTITSAFNGNWWGPTLIWYKGQTVHVNVKNDLQDSTTVHWHGMHLPAVMDGGPHQLIPPGSLWSPYWTVTNNAATYWYHPHLHMMAEKQLTEGLGGMIIVRDSVESGLPLPRTYGVDDIPLALTDRSFSANQLTVVPYGDSMLTNGVLHAQYTLPAQVVRLRILDAAIERSYNLGLSTGDSFYVVTTDGGLLNAPVAVKRFLISPGERVEILINLTGRSGSLDLMAYNSALSGSIGGGDSLPQSPFGNALAKRNFPVLHINVGTQTASPITAIPSSLATNTYPDIADASLTRQFTMTDSQGVPGILGPNAFILNHRLFDYNRIDFSVGVDKTEIWQITSRSFFSHPFHVHDVEFYILSINGAAPPAYQAGWKDVVLVESPGGPPGGGGSKVYKIIARFADYSDSIHPFMYHCHIALHEDEGMMGQFTVIDTSATTGLSDPTGYKPDFAVYPNPAQQKIYVDFGNSGMTAYYMKLVDAMGRTLYMRPRPELDSGIDISDLATGVYYLQIMDDRTKATISKKFVKQ